MVGQASSPSVVDLLLRCRHSQKMRPELKCSCGEEAGGCKNRHRDPNSHVGDGGDGMVVKLEPQESEWRSAILRTWGCQVLPQPREQHVERPCGREGAVRSEQGAMECEEGVRPGQ